MITVDPRTVQLLTECVDALSLAPLKWTRKLTISRAPNIVAQQITEHPSPPAGIWQTFGWHSANPACLEPP